MLDGDEDYFEGRLFCAVEASRTLAERAAAVGAGVTFSLAIVLLRQEYESLLIAAADQLPGVLEDAPRPPDPEVAPRGAKKWLRDHLAGGYKNTKDQLPLTRGITDLTPLRQLKCFRRLERAVAELARAVVEGKPIRTPCTP